MGMPKFPRPMDRPKAKTRLKRRGSSIRAYVGPNGHGKTWLACYDLIPGLDAGRPVLSTVRILDYRNPRQCDDPLCEYPGHPDHQAAHPNYVPFTDYAQLLDWRDGDVFMDEVTGVASSREVASMPVQVANYLVQLRRRNVSLIWTAPAWGRSDKIIREVTQSVTVTLGYFPKRRPPVPGEPPRIWSDRQGFYARTYDALLMDEFESSSAEHVPHMFAAFYWRPGALTDSAYDTLDPVTSLGWANESGMCMGCGGKRTIPRCSCSTHLARGSGKRHASTPAGACAEGVEVGAAEPAQLDLAPMEPSPLFDSLGVSGLDFVTDSA